MNEAETRAEHIDPALKAAGWGVVEGSQIRREFGITRLPCGLVTLEPGFECGRIFLNGHGASQRNMLLEWWSPPSQRFSSLCASALRLALILAASAWSWVNSRIMPFGSTT